MRTAHCTQRAGARAATIKHHATPARHALPYRVLSRAALRGTDAPRRMLAGARPLPSLACLPAYHLLTARYMRLCVRAMLISHATTGLLLLTISAAAAAPCAAFRGSAPPLSPACCLLSARCAPRSLTYPPPAAALCLPLRTVLSNMRDELASFHTCPSPHACPATLVAHPTHTHILWVLRSLLPPCHRYPLPLTPPPPPVSPLHYHTCRTHWTPATVLL